MSDLFIKLIFYFKRPRLIVVTGKERNLTAEAIFQVLRAYFKVAKIEKLNLKSVLRNKVLILVSTLQEPLDYFVENGEKPILVVTHIGEIPPDVYWFAGEKEDIKKIAKLAKRFPVEASLILNFDDETVREIGDKSKAFCLTFGFQENAQLQVSDFHTNKIGTNFKINFQGNIVPIWLENLFGRANIYAALAAVSCGLQLDLNLVEISQALKNFKGLDGKMKLIKENENE